ncbi:hypothetical protein EC919_108324 [Pseudomonas graminis]|nr:hypothetical protein EC919_108324 [Pseudomonas graminis]
MGYSGFLCYECYPASSFDNMSQRRKKASIAAFFVQFFKCNSQILCCECGVVPNHRNDCFVVIT